MRKSHICTPGGQRLAGARTNLVAHVGWLHPISSEIFSMTRTADLRCHCYLPLVHISRPPHAVLQKSYGERDTKQHLVEKKPLVLAWPTLRSQLTFPSLGQRLRPGPCEFMQSLAMRFRNSTHTLTKQRCSVCHFAALSPHYPAFPYHTKPSETRQTTEYNRRSRLDLEPLRQNERPRRDDAPPWIGCQRARSCR